MLRRNIYNDVTMITLRTGDYKLSSTVTMQGLDFVHGRLVVALSYATF